METKFDMKAGLAALKAGEISAIELGVEGNPGGYMSAFMIRYMDTIGGRQFAIHHLSHGRTGSGMYLGDDAELTESEAHRFADKYFTPHPNPAIRAVIEKNRSKMKAVDFFAV